MDILVQKVSTGDIIVFEKAKRELVLIDRENTDTWGREKDQSFEAALKFAHEGRAQHFDRGALERIQAALAGVVLLV